MLNKGMNTKIEQNQNQVEKPAEKDIKQPDVVAGIYVRGHVKISDPETGEVILETAS